MLWRCRNVSPASEGERAGVRGFRPIESHEPPHPNPASPMGRGSAHERVADAVLNFKSGSESGALYRRAYNHFFPKRYYDALLETPAGAKDLGKRVRGIPALSNLGRAAARGSTCSRTIRRSSRSACRRSSGSGAPTSRPRWRALATTGSPRSWPSIRASSSATRRCCRCRMRRSSPRQGGRAGARGRRQRDPDRQQRQWSAAR